MERPERDGGGRHTRPEGLKKDDLVGYVASVAAEKTWAPPALNLRLDFSVIEEPAEVEPDDVQEEVEAEASEGGEPAIG